MKNILRFQPLHQPVSNQLVVFRSAQVPSHILERREETRRSPVVVKLLDFGERSAVHAMPLTQFEQSRGLDRAFEMQMEFGLRQRKNETGR